ncbi:MAG: hypothetical protein C3F19_03715 [Rhodocyclales bacterium]|jgi:hypothetical protein|nr:MAG: hypothetical protein C3F19_03715 [Rhodocyclales bacterium]
MKKPLVLAVLLLLGAASAAWAHDRGPRARLGVYVGVPMGYYYWWHEPPPPYYYYYPPTIIVRPQEPQVYIERGAPQQAPQAEAYWYYCSESRSYYPYVKDCPGGWQRVVPTPPPK